MTPENMLKFGCRKIEIDRRSSYDCSEKKLENLVQSSDVNKILG